MMLFIDFLKKFYSCNFNLKDVFTIGPSALPDELKQIVTKSYDKRENIRIGILSGKVVNKNTENVETESNKSFETNQSLSSSKKKNLSTEYTLFVYFDILN